MFSTELEVAIPESRHCGASGRRIIPNNVPAQVYNITRYLKFHPGGVDWILKGAGRDCTVLFQKYHAWVNADMLLKECLIGMLAASHPAAAASP